MGKPQACDGLFICFIAKIDACLLFVLPRLLETGGYTQLHILLHPPRLLHLPQALILLSFRGHVAKRTHIQDTGTANAKCQLLKHMQSL